MAGKKRQQSRSGARKAQFAKRAGTSKKNGKSVGGRITEANAERRVKYHKDVTVPKYEKRTAVTDGLMEKVVTKFNLNSKGKYALKRLVGTINKSRLEAVLNNTLDDTTWWPARRLKLTPIDHKKTEENGGTVVYKSTNASDLIRGTQLASFLHY